MCATLSRDKRDDAEFIVFCLWVTYSLLEAQLSVKLRFTSLGCGMGEYLNFWQQTMARK